MENEQQQFPYQSVYTFTYMLHMNDSAASSNAKKSLPTTGGLEQILYRYIRQ